MCPTTSSHDRRCVRCGYSLAGLAADGVCPECAAPLWWSEEPNWRILELVDSYRRVAFGWRLLAAAAMAELAALLPTVMTFARAPARLDIAIWVGVVCAAAILRVAGAGLLAVDAWKSDRRRWATVVMTFGLARAAALGILWTHVPGVPPWMIAGVAVSALWLDQGVQASLMYRAGRSLDEMWKGFLNASVIVAMITGGLGFAACLIGAVFGYAGAVFFIWGALGYVVSSGMMALCYFQAATALVRDHPTAQADRGELG